MSNFSWGLRSHQNMSGVHHDLREVMNRAIQLSKVDMVIIEGLRSKARQQQLFNQGHTRTLNSRHITGHALDVVPWINGEISWDWTNYYPVADAILKAAKEVEVPIVWGGAWNLRPFNQWGKTSKQASDAYVAIRKKEGKKVFLDGPHFELDKQVYP